jgi:hypothetical protein
MRRSGLQSSLTNQYIWKVSHINESVPEDIPEAGGSALQDQHLHRDHHSLLPHNSASTALHCTKLHCTALHSTALHCTALSCTKLNCTAGLCRTYGRSPSVSWAGPTLVTGLRHCLDFITTKCNWIQIFSLTYC